MRLGAFLNEAGPELAKQPVQKLAEILGDRQVRVNLRAEIGKASQVEDGRQRLGLCRAPADITQSQHVGVKEVELLVAYLTDAFRLSGTS